MDLTTKRALVFGGTSGIGLGIAEALAAEGCAVAICGTRRDALDAALARIGTSGTVIGRTCDVTDRGAVAATVEWVTAELGGVDILVNSAGMNVGNRSMATIDPVDFDRVLAVNTTGVFNAIHAVLPGMRERREGLIVNIVSLAGLRVMQLAGAPYCVSKFATAALGTYVNLEDAANGVRVTNVYPGETNTPLVDKRPAPPSAEKRAAMLQPEDVASMVVAIAKLPARAVVPELVITPPHMMVG